jgi:hypothetical protein
MRFQHKPLRMLIVKQMSRIFLLLISIGLMAGCKLAVIVVEGGEVQSTGSGTCVAGNICIADVTDPNFSETFTAVPSEGWYFQKWNSGDRFFWGNALDPKRTLSFEGYEESKAVEDMVASSEVFYLMPIFKPVPDIISAAGKEWLQPALFNLSWDQINAVCPGGVCRDNGRLNGYDMTGWTWASVNEVFALFNYYIGRDQLVGDSGAYVGDFDSKWATAFFADGWQATIASSEARRIIGWTRNDPNSSGLSSAVEINDSLMYVKHVPPDAAGLDIVHGGDAYDRGVYLSSWFFRTP